MRRFFRFDDLTGTLAAGGLMLAVLSAAVWAGMFHDVTRAPGVDPDLTVVFDGTTDMTVRAGGEATGARVGRDGTRGLVVTNPGDRDLVVAVVADGSPDGWWVPEDRVVTDTFTVPAGATTVRRVRSYGALTALAPLGVAAGAALAAGATITAARRRGPVTGGIPAGMVTAH